MASRGLGFPRSTECGTPPVRVYPLFDSHPGRIFEGPLSSRAASKRVFASSVTGTSYGEEGGGGRNPCKHRGPWVTRHKPLWNLRGGVVRLRLIRLDYLRPTASPLPRSIIIPSKCVASSRGQPLITRGVVDRFNWSRPNVAIRRGRGRRSLKTVAEIWLWAGGGIFIPWTNFGKHDFKCFSFFFFFFWFWIRNFILCWIVCKFMGLVPRIINDLDIFSFRCTVFVEKDL